MVLIGASEAETILVGVAALLFLIALMVLRHARRTLREASSARKSGEVRVGGWSEVMGPLLKDFPVDVKEPGTSIHFLGKPVDYVHFAVDGAVTFIEVKSGDAQLTPGQRAIRDAIGRGAVRFVTWRAPMSND